MQKKTCANCRAYDAEASECHRHPVKPWISMLPSDWCGDHLPEKDATGWRMDWPEKEATIQWLKDHPEGRTLEQLSIDTVTPDLGIMRATLTALRAEGHCQKDGPLWFPVLPPAPAGSMAALTEPAPAPRHTPSPPPAAAPSSPKITIGYYDKNSAKPYPSTYADPDKLIAASVGGKGMGYLMQEMRKAGQPHDLFATMNATKHLVRFGWLVSKVRDGDTKATYSPGPSCFGLAANAEVPAASQSPTDATERTPAPLSPPPPTHAERLARIQMLFEASLKLLPTSEAEAWDETDLACALGEAGHRLTEADDETIRSIFAPNARDVRNEIRIAGGKAWRDPNPPPRPEPSGTPWAGSRGVNLMEAPKRTPEEEAAYKEKRDRIERDAEPDDLPID